jgi:hypothetical protein
VHQQLSQPSEAIVHFGRALKLREQVLKSAEDLCFQINNGNGNGVSGSKRQAQQALRAARAAVASTLYNRGLIYHQQVCVLLGFVSRLKIAFRSSFSCLVSFSFILFILATLFQPRVCPSFFSAILSIDPLTS